jgi:chemotaxis protein methyltransferase CheR
MKHLLNEDQAFSFLKRRILEDRGLDCEQYKDGYLKRRIGVRLRARGASDYLEYARILKTDPGEYNRLLDELTINVTQFFRDADVFERIADTIIPEIIESRRARKSRSIRVWSAGCSSGEEPYSIAILIDSALGDEIKDWSIRVVGSDIDDRSIHLARVGEYASVEMIRGLDRDRYFDRVKAEKGERFLVRENLKRLVKIEKQNLLEEHARRHFDMVLCRNVLIYFGRSVQAKMVGSLSSGLSKDGYLVLGKSETLSLQVVRNLKPVFPRERIYRLVGAGAPGHFRGGGNG